jgi:hypothetical protein
MTLPRDRITVPMAGVCIERIRVHAERIVRSVLGQRGGVRC